MRRQPEKHIKLISETLRTQKRALNFYKMQQERENPGNTHRIFRKKKISDKKNRKKFHSKMAVTQNLKLPWRRGEDERKGEEREIENGKGSKICRGRKGNSWTVIQVLIPESVFAYEATNDWWTQRKDYCKMANLSFT